ncbi:hypothetical protein E1B28_006640 [Marasmius oreades]|uniref:RRM domain-containing protein n=1 Tax=Marasmius oreades TaxID=181124 RepID=A0A9P7UWJ4_9AGAR|nr:uncharacterized protein E1B28_006640 [Marasmius oreades]KAG7095956.1 hypothetical protein E1B28_006640 [Marasmius oreades]
MLFWGDLEPWMDEEYVKQVCALMGWEPQSIKVPPPNGPNANNPGYCFLTFPSQAHATSVIAQLNSSATPPIMPNSAKPFQISWASAVQLPHTAPSPFSPNGVQSQSNIQQQYPTEYSIFVGDLAPETSNSDLVAVFRNPVLGLRNDREPKFIRPFLSCKSAKIMLDPVTGVSRGYGFVRFTDEADQQRALIEMHGLYCLSRPMRISPATAKFKPPNTAAIPTQTFPSPFQVTPQSSATNQPVTLARPLSGSLPCHNNAASIDNGANQPRSVSSPIATPNHPTVASNIATSSTASSLDHHSNGSNSPASGARSSASNGSLASTATVFSNSGSDADVKHLSQQIVPQQYNGTISSEESSTPQLPVFSIPTHGQVPPSSELSSTARYMLSEESWKHHAQARAILGNLIGPNGEQLTSTDPYNTTVFVGGLSPLINEDTLRTFFTPFGDIHYVKVPVGKNCGFVQFVRKADAEKAIEKMQGFPIGGSRIRLSWGRSQYKAAQAAAQAAQTAALQLQGTYGLPSNPTPATGSGANMVPPSLAHLHPLLQSQSSSVAPSQTSLQHRQSIDSGPLAGVDVSNLTQEQAIQLLQKLTNGGYMDIPVSADERQHGRQMGSRGFGNGTDHLQQTQFSSNAKHTTQQHHVDQDGVASVYHHLPSPPGAGLYAEEKLRAAHLASREDVIGSNSQARYNSNNTHNQHQLGSMFDHSLFGFNPTAASGGSAPGDRRSSVMGGSSFSPFSPDPNGVSTPPNGDGLPTSLQRRESLVSASLGGMTSGQTSLSSSTPSGNSLPAKFSPTTARPTVRYGGLNGSSQGTIPSPLPTNNRGSNGRNNDNGVGQHYQQQQHHHPNDSFDVMHDVNGTLASLDLDSSPRPPTVGSPTNISFNPSRTIPQFGVSAWSMNIASQARKGLASPAGGSESGSTDSKYLSSKGDREGLRAVSPM